MRENEEGIRQSGTDVEFGLQEFQITVCFIESDHIVATNELRRTQTSLDIVFYEGSLTYPGERRWSYAKALL